MDEQMKKIYGWMTKWMNMNELIDGDMNATG